MNDCCLLFSYFDYEYITVCDFDCAEMVLIFCNCVKMSTRADLQNVAACHSAMTFYNSVYINNCYRANYLQAYWQ